MQYEPKFVFAHVLVLIERLLKFEGLFLCAVLDQILLVLKNTLVYSQQTSDLEFVLDQSIGVLPLFSNSQRYAKKANTSSTSNVSTLLEIFSRDSILSQVH